MVPCHKEKELRDLENIQNTHTERMIHIVKTVEKTAAAVEEMPDKIIAKLKEYGDLKYADKLENDRQIAAINEKLNVGGVKQAILWAAGTFVVAAVAALIVSAIVKMALK